MIYSCTYPIGKLLPLAHHTHFHTQSHMLTHTSHPTLPACIPREPSLERGGGLAVDPDCSEGRYQHRRPVRMHPRSVLWPLAYAIPAARAIPVRRHRRKGRGLGLEMESGLGLGLGLPERRHQPEGRGAEAVVWRQPGVVLHS